MTGVASATASLPDLQFNTDPSDTSSTTLNPGDTMTIPAGYCSIHWTVTGAPGGADTGTNSGALGAAVDTETPLSGTAARNFTFTIGTAGGDAGASTGGTGGAGGHGANGTDGVDDGAGNFGGGGGGATTVDDGSGLFIEAPGGDGAGAASPNGVGGGTPQYPGDATNTSTTPQNATPGLWAYATPCPPPTAPVVPAAPNVKWVMGENDHSLSFQLWKADGSNVTSTQYSLDNGSTWHTVATDVTGDFQYEGTIDGLITKHSYSVEFRFQTTDGTSDPSAATTAAPLGAAPQNLKATVGPSSITLSWDAPAGVTGITGYRAQGIPGAQPQSNDGEVDCPALDAAARTCTITVPAGSVYSVGVTALSPDPGMAAFLVSDMVRRRRPRPRSPPVTAP